MKKILILLVLGSIFLHYKPQPWLEEIYVEYSKKLSVVVSNTFGTSIRMKSSKVYNDIKPEFNSFSRKEQLAVKELSLTRDSVEDFYNKNCTSSYISNMTFHPKNLRKVCTTIERFLSGR